MNADHLVGFIVQFEDGEFLNAAEAVVVFGDKRREEIKTVLAPEKVRFLDLYAGEVFSSWEELGVPAFTFDEQSFHAFDPIAISRSCSPSGTLLYSLTREPVEGEDIFVTYAAPTSRS
jgi:hypothetical protein